jgi:hypothetical protein
MSTDKTMPRSGFIRKIRGYPVGGFSGNAPLLAYTVGSFTPASANASRRSTHVPHLPQWISPPL